MLLGTSEVALPAWVFVTSVVAPVVVSALAFIASTWLGLADIRVKARSEAIEADVKLLQSFAALAPTADAREGAFLSEAVARRLVEHWQGPPDHLDLRQAVAEGPVSAARQAAVITAIAELTTKHDILEKPGRAMLRGLKHLKDTGDDDVRAAYEVAIQRVGGLD